MICDHLSQDGASSPRCDNETPSADTFNARFLSSHPSLALLLNTRHENGVKRDVTEVREERSVLKRYLEWHTRQMIQLMDSHNFDLDNWSQLLAPSFYGTPGTSTSHLRCNRQDFVHFIAAIYIKFPNWRVRLLDVNVELEGQSNTATVWQDVVTEGVPSNGIATRSYTKLVVRRQKGGQWKAVGMESMHGGMGLDGALGL